MSYTLSMVTKNCVRCVRALCSLRHHVISFQSTSFALCCVCTIPRKAGGTRRRISNWRVTVFELKYLAQPSERHHRTKDIRNRNTTFHPASEIHTSPQEYPQRARLRTNKLRARKLQVLVRVSAIESGSDETTCLTSPRLSPQSVSERDT